MAVEDLEKLLRALPAEGALRGLEVLETLVRNVVRAPEEEKFRRLRTSNEKLAPLLNLPGVRRKIRPFRLLFDQQHAI